MNTASEGERIFRIINPARIESNCPSHFGRGINEGPTAVYTLYSMNRSSRKERSWSTSSLYFQAVFIHRYII